MGTKAHYLAHATATMDGGVGQAILCGIGVEEYVTWK